MLNFNKWKIVIFSSIITYFFNLHRLNISLYKNNIINPFKKMNMSQVEWCDAKN